jgi:hypothetical protein
VAAGFDQFDIAIGMMSQLACGKQGWMSQVGGIFVVICRERELEYRVAGTEHRRGGRPGSSSMPEDLNHSSEK